jgi:hypothetical protein
MKETWTEGLRRLVDEAGPHTPQEHLGAPIVIWLGHLPFRVREAIFLVCEGYERQQERSYAKGAETRRARRKGAA